jgi:pyruvate formate lyase activating enzyme
MIIAGLQRVTLLDFPGRVAATLFLAGCNLRCGFCHNRWMIDATGVTPTHTVEQFLAWLDGRQGLLDGVCISGGEPALWGDELAALLAEIKARGFETKLDTNGTRPQLVEGLLDRALLDYVAMDIKAPLDARYAALSGVPVDLDAIRATMALLRARAPAYEFRTTVAPQLAERDLRDIAALLRPDEPWFLQAYLETPQVDPEYAGQAFLAAGELERIAAELRGEGVRVAVRGGE